jgi:hypothetical protein
MWQLGFVVENRAEIEHVEKSSAGFALPIALGLGQRRPVSLFADDLPATDGYAHEGTKGLPIICPRPMIMRMKTPKQRRMLGALSNRHGANVPLRSTAL